jgi:hypothetical protein
MVRISEGNTKVGVLGSSIGRRASSAFLLCSIRRCLWAGGPGSRSGSLGGRSRGPHGK